MKTDSQVEEFQHITNNLVTELKTHLRAIYERKF
jgi:hypothetical protein